MLLFLLNHITAKHWILTILNQYSTIVLLPKKSYRLVAEKELPQIFKIIGLESALGKIKTLVQKRNDMAHASGHLIIPNDKAFEINASAICDSIRDIHKCMDAQIRNWFGGFLVRYCNNEFMDYDEISDIITEQMIEGFNLSLKELSVCNEMSVKNLISDKPDFKANLQEFKRSLKEYCEDIMDF